MEFDVVLMFIWPPSVSTSPGVGALVVGWDAGGCTEPLVVLLGLGAVVLDVVPVGWVLLDEVVLLELVLELLVVDEDDVVLVVDVGVSQNLTLAVFVTEEPSSPVTVAV